MITLQEVSSVSMTNVPIRLSLQMSPDEDGLETSVVGLRFKVREKHFKASGDLKAQHVFGGPEKLYHLIQI